MYFFNIIKYQNNLYQTLIPQTISLTLNFIYLFIYFFARICFTSSFLSPLFLLGLSHSSINSHKLKCKKIEIYD
jgi:hypothetical protein